MPWPGRRGAPAAICLALAVVAVASGRATATRSASGLAPPEVAANAASGWPAHDFDLSNSRDDTLTAINASNVGTLKLRWSFRLRYSGEYGSFTSNPIVAGGQVYFEDPDSDVFDLDEQTGALVWEHRYGSVTPSGGPNGVALGYGLLFGATEGAVFALDPRNGRQVWIHPLIANSREGIDMAPQLYDGTVLISTIPGNSTSYYTAGAYGTVYALNATTGRTLWSFSTVQDGARLWGDPSVNGGGGLWYPPAVDASGRVFIGVGNPSPYPSSAADPNGRSRPGPNLYTDSLVALNGATGRLLWYQQITPHDIRDYDFQDPPIIATEPVKGVPTEVVIGAGKSGKVVAFRADDGERLWTLNIGKHNSNEYGPLPVPSSTLVPTAPVTYCPGSLGGVLTPMAEAHNTVYVPWIDLCFRATADGITGAGGRGTGGLAAVNAATGAIVWSRLLASIDAGAATVANDVVFTSTYDGRIYALSTRTGATLWSTQAPDGINSFPALTRNMLIVGAGAPGLSKRAQPQIVAYSLGGAPARSTR